MKMTNVDRKIRRLRKRSRKANFRKKYFFIISTPLLIIFGIFWSPIFFGLIPCMLCSAFAQGWSAKKMGEKADKLENEYY